jgi:CYTH domain-containing protein
MKTLELERTFLARFIPKQIGKGVEIMDIYIPKDCRHSVLRIRRKGDLFEITKKIPVIEGDPSNQTEHTINLSKEEFYELSKLEGKRTSKIRYASDYKGVSCEVDVFQGALKGLVLIDFEFVSEKEKNDFDMPEFCLADVTQEEFLAGGVLCGKSYEEIKERLEKFGYKKL